MTHEKWKTMTREERIAWNRRHDRITNSILLAIILPIAILAGDFLGDIISDLLPFI